MRSNKANDFARQAGRIGVILILTNEDDPSAANPGRAGDDTAIGLAGQTMA